MSFSFAAAGTRAETLSSLAKNTALTADGQAVLKLVTQVIEEAAEKGGDGTPLRFNVNASGHTGPGQVPFINVALTAEYAR